MRSNPRIVFVDGLPGSGKTTLARWLETHLKERGQPSQFISEYDLDHPLHWFSYHDGAEFKPPDFDSIPLAKYIDNSLAMWDQFQGEMQGGSDTLIIEGYPVLNSAGVMLWGDASRNEYQAYMAQVRDVLEPVQPILIYLRSTDLEAALARKLDHLQAEGQLELFMASMNHQPYLRHRELSGKPGVRDLWESVQWALEYFYQQDFETVLIMERDTIDATTAQMRVEAFFDRSS